jgi:hypothetical protein
MNRCCESFDVNDRSDSSTDASAFFQWPFPSPLLFENESSDARDHCANERSEFISGAVIYLFNYLFLFISSLFIVFELDCLPWH